MPKIQYLPLDVVAMEQARKFSASACQECVGLTELCPACQDLRDTRDAEIAHQIVDESEDYIYQGYGNKKRAVANGGAITEGFRALSVIRDLPSGHDWTDREGEFLEPISLLVDRLYDLETSVTMSSHETICETCRYTHNKHIQCPNCN